MQDKSTIRIPLFSQKYPGMYALIDEADFEMVGQYRWGLQPSSSGRIFYAIRFDVNQRGARGGKKKMILMHREINQTPEGMHTDHIDGDGLNNTRGNLRTVEVSQNIANAHTPILGKSGYIGVKFEAKYKKPYRAIVRRAEVGRFSTAEDAAREVDRYRRIIWGDHVKLNFPDLVDK